MGAILETQCCYFFRYRSSQDSRLKKLAQLRCFLVHFFLAAEWSELSWVLSADCWPAVNRCYASFNGKKTKRVIFWCQMSSEMPNLITVQLGLQWTRSFIMLNIMGLRSVVLCIMYTISAFWTVAAYDLYSRTQYVSQRMNLNAINRYI